MAHVSADRTAPWDALGTIAAVLVALWLPTAAALVSPAGEASSLDNRRLAEFPSLSLAPQRLQALPVALEGWLTDRLGFREALIAARSRLWLHALGQAANPFVLVGRDGWLFNARPRFLDHSRGHPALSAAEFETWRSAFVERQGWLAERGVEYLVVFVPMKSLVYPEKLPAWIRPLDEFPTERLARDLADSGVRVLDLLPQLRAARRSTRLYHRSDIHWNDEGAYVGYRAILEALADFVPALAGAMPVAVTASRLEVEGLALSRMLGLATGITEDVFILEPRESRAAGIPASEGRIPGMQRSTVDVVRGSGDPSLPRTVVFRDSFARELIPFLSNHFERVVFEWSPDVVAATVAREKPDIVIHEIWGGSLYGAHWGADEYPHFRHSVWPWLER